jgi:hypothetical protein
MLIFLFFIIGCYGITNILVYGKIFRPLRKFLSEKNKFLYSLISCMMCTGFWIGVFVFLLFQYMGLFFIPITQNILNYIFMTIFTGGFTSGVIWLIYLLVKYLESYIKDEL